MEYQLRKKKLENKKFRSLASHKPTFPAEFYDSLSDNISIRVATASGNMKIKNVSSCLEGVEIMQSSIHIINGETQKSYSDSLAYHPLSLAG